MEHRSDSEFRENDRRKSVRFAPQHADDATAYLRIGFRRVPVRILDRSAGGYLIEINGRTRATADQTVELWAAGGREPLRVLWKRYHNDRTDVGLQHVPHELPWRQYARGALWMLFAALIALGLAAWF